MSAGRRLRSWRLRVRSLFRRARVDDELSREIRFHLEREAAEFEAQGMTPQDAMHAARQRFGPLSPVVEAVRDERAMGFLDHTLQDLRYGARSLLRTPVLTIAAVGTLAIGIGATSSLFGLLDQLLFRRLAVPQPDRLFSVVRTRPGSVGESVPYPLFAALAADWHSGQLAGYAFRTVPLGATDDSAVVQLTSGTWFQTVGIRPAIGRAFAEPNNVRTAVISDRFWRREFARSPSAVGATITLSGNVFAVTGVAPPGFTGLSLDFPVDVWIPIEAQPLIDGQSLLDGDAARGRNWTRVVARIDADASPTSAAAAANVLLGRAAAAGRVIADSADRLSVTPASRPTARDGDQIVRLLALSTALVAFVLLIACANIANLQLARAITRRRELGIRLAMGAGRARLVRQLMTESIMLAICAGATGLGLVVLVERTVAVSGGSYLGPGVAQLIANGADARMLGFTFVLSLIVAVAFGLAPALRSTRLDLVTSLHQTTLAGRGAIRGGAKSLLLVGQMAMAILLLVSAGTVERTLQSAESLDLGFNPANVEQLTVDWRGMSDDAIRLAAQDIARGLRATPGVQSASISVPPAFGKATSSTSAFHVAGDASGKPHDVELSSVSPDFFTTMRIRVARGRAFSENDRVGSGSVVVLNETAARLFFPGEDAVGRQFDLMGAGNRVQVVGVVADTRAHSLVAAPPPMAYIPFAQDPGVDPQERSIEVRAPISAVSLKALTEGALQHSAGHAVQIRSMRDAIGESLVVQRVSAWTTGALGVAGVLLAMLGVYGLHSFFVARRTTELAVRLALGAPAGTLRWLVWKQAMQPVMLGSAIGIALAWACTQFARGKLFGLVTLDIAVVLAATALMIGVASVACYLPARRASRLSPATALRSE